MRLELLAKDESSGRNGCPSVFIDVDSTTGEAVVWADRLPWRRRFAVPNRLRGERGVRIRMETLCAAVDAHRAR